MSRVIRNEKTGKVELLRIQNAVVQYPAVIEPRGEEDLKPGTYGAQFIIKDPEGIAAVKEYVTEVAKEAIVNLWGGKVPKNMTIPYYVGDDENDVEANGIVLKTNSKFAPKVYIRRPGQRTIALDDVEEIYPGMIADADIKIRAYTHASGNKGVTAYLQAICKTGAGTPLYVSSASSFDIEDFDYTDEETEAATFDLEDITTPAKHAEAKPAAKKATAPKAATAKKETKVAVTDFDLSALEASSSATVDDDFEIDGISETTTLEDLLK